MTASWVKTIIILPFNVIVILPGLLLLLTGYRWQGVAPLHLTAGLILFVGGLSLAFWTMRLFARIGKGTAAPWNPPKRLVVAGPYRHVRNPMITSVLSMLLGEAVLLSSWAVFALFAVFLIANMVYFPLREEPKLAERFGDSYRLYRQNVPRWLPRLSGWNLPAEAIQGDEQV